MPPQYAGRTPFFMLARRQVERMKELQDFMQHLTRVASKSERVESVSASRWAGGAWPSLHPAAKRKDFAHISAGNSVLVWAMGFWKLFHAEQRRNSVKKAEMLEMTVVGDMVRPFRHWHIFVMGRRVESQKQTQQAFVLERQMLEVTVKHLEEEKEDVRAELGACNATLERLRKRLEEQTRERAALADRLAEARPETVKAVLCSVLNFVFEAVLEEAQLTRQMVRQDIESKEVAVLLATEEESLQKLAAGDGLLIRWLNYHLTQFKVLASEVLESVARARSDESARLESRSLGELSLRDAEAYCHRCRIVRALPRVTHLVGEELQDGAVLSVLYAALASSVASHGGGALNPSLLWPLDERAIESRVLKLCDALKSILPTRASQSLLRPPDIAGGSSKFLPAVLAALFLHRSRLPRATAASEAGAAAADGDGEGSVRLVPEVSGRLASKSAAASAAVATKKVTTTTFDLPAGPQKDTADPISMVIGAMERVAGSCGYDALQDITRLLREEETPGDLEQMEPEELLLRWVNMHIESKDQSAVVSMAELKGGKVLFELLNKIAGDVLRALPDFKPMSDARVPAEKQRIMTDLVVQCGNRCTSFPILTKDVVLDGPVDLLAACVAGLFVCRPCLHIQPKSRLKKSLDLLANIAGCGQQVPSDTFVDSCAAFADGMPIFEQALSSVRDASDMQARLDRRVHTYLADLLAQRAQGLPVNVAGDSGSSAPMQHETLRPQFLAPDKIRSVLMLEMLRADAPQAQDDSIGQPELLADILRKHRPLFKEVFRHYSTPVFSTEVPEAAAAASPKSKKSTLNLAHQSILVLKTKRRGQDTDESAILDLRSFTRIHKDCRIRALRLRPADVEDIYNEVISRFNSINNQNQAATGHIVKTKQPIDGLRFETFIEAMLVLGCRIRVGDIPAFDFATKFRYLVEKHLWPLATRRINDLLYKLCYDPGLPAVLRRYDVMLRIIFQKYATMQGDPTVMQQARQLSARGTIVCDPGTTARLGKMALKECNTMTVEGALAMFEHAGLLGHTLDAKAMQSIVSGLQHSELVDFNPEATEGDAGSDKDSESGSAPCEPFAYQEFIDVLVAVVLYKDPNPFNEFDIRFERLLLHGLLHPLKDHWHNMPPWANLSSMLEANLYKEGFQSRASYLDAGVYSSPSKHQADGEDSAASVPSSPSSPVLRKRAALGSFQPIMENT